MEDWYLKEIVDDVNLRVINEYVDKYVIEESDRDALILATSNLIKKDDHPHLKILLGDALMRNGDYEKAWDVYCKINIDKIPDKEDDIGHIRPIIAYTYSVLGNLVSNGMLGMHDYNRAFAFYTDGERLGDLNCKLELALFHKSGLAYDIKIDLKKYMRLIKKLYENAKNDKDIKLLIRISNILSKEYLDMGKEKDAFLVAQEGMKIIKKYIQYQYYRDYENIRGIINTYYKIKGIKNIDFFSLYEILKKPAKIRFTYDGYEHVLECICENNENYILFHGSKYKNIEEWYEKAKIENMPIIANCKKLKNIQYI